MLSCYQSEQDSTAIPITPLTGDQLSSWMENADQRAQRWVCASAFKASSSSTCLIPNEKGDLELVLTGAGNTPLWSIAGLSTSLPEGCYRLDCDWGTADKNQAAVGWGLGAYRFSRYSKGHSAPARLLLDDTLDCALIERQVTAAYLGRDLINTPAADMMPQHLAESVQQLATQHGANVEVTAGQALLEQNYPAIHTVGRASVHPPALIDLRWGDTTHPRVTLVGKGVCFDSGGLDLKPSKGMRLMKKDMGGAAQVLGIAAMVMDAKLPVSLRVLIPAVENAVSGDAYRPGDVLATRAGLNVEVDNTDAEGRIILCDALAEACTENPEVLIDFATLTGAARVAVGTELPAMFCNDETMAAEIRSASVEHADQVWRLPLHADYKDMLDSRIADLVNSPSSPYGGAITAALFLEAFVSTEVSWAHFDVMAWNLRNRPGRPEGGELMGARAVYHYLQQRYGN